MTVCQKDNMKLKKTKILFDGIVIFFSSNGLNISEPIWFHPKNGGGDGNTLMGGSQVGVLGCWTDG